MIPFNDGSLKGLPFEFWYPKGNIFGSGSKVPSRVGPVDKLHRSAPCGIIGSKERGIHDGANRRADPNDCTGSF